MLPPLSIYILGPPPGFLGWLFGGFLLFIPPALSLKSLLPRSGGQRGQAHAAQGWHWLYSYPAPPYKHSSVGRDPTPGVPYGSLCYVTAVGDVVWHTPHRAIRRVGGVNGLHNNVIHNKNNNRSQCNAVRGSTKAKQFTGAGINLMAGAGTAKKCYKKFYKNGNNNGFYSSCGTIDSS